jgi:hypothetical protein
MTTMSRTYVGRYARWGLKSMFVVLTVLFIWLGILANRILIQQGALAVLRHGGHSRDTILVLEGEPRSVAFSGSLAIMTYRPGCCEVAASVLGRESVIRITSIELIGPDFIDEDLAAMNGLLHLTRVELLNTRITDAAIEELRANRPHVQVERLGEEELIESLEEML